MSWSTLKFRAMGRLHCDHSPEDPATIGEHPARAPVVQSIQYFAHIFTYKNMPVSLSPSSLPQTMGSFFAEYCGHTLYIVKTAGANVPRWLRQCMHDLRIQQWCGGHLVGVHRSVPNAACPMSKATCLASSYCGSFSRRNCGLFGGPYCLLLEHYDHAPYLVRPSSPKVA